MRFSGRLVIIIALAVTVLLVSNITAIKPISLFTLPFEFLGDNLYVVSAAIVCFPLSYIISDVLTEVYGFRVARGVIWLGFVCNLIMVFFFWLGDIIPGAVFWEDESSFETILGATGWILLGSFTAYLAGEFTNAGIMVVLKNKTQGRHLWLRTISSTVAGQGIDSIIFFTIAFGASGFWIGDDGSWNPIWRSAIFAWVAKSLYEMAATPLTYAVVGWLKRTEKMDVYDDPRSLNPFGIFGEGEGGSVNAADRPPSESAV